VFLIQASMKDDFTIDNYNLTYFLKIKSCRDFIKPGVNPLSLFNNLFRNFTILDDLIIHRRLLEQILLELVQLKSLVCFFVFNNRFFYIVIIDSLLFNKEKREPIFHNFLVCPTL